MADKKTQIEALLSREPARLILAEGLDPKENASYVQVFDVTRAEIDAHVAIHGLPTELNICAQDSRRDGLYLVHEGDWWQLYTQDRGCRYDEETFADEPHARAGITSLLLSNGGPTFVHLLGFEEAILHFTDWDHPWYFLARVEARVTHKSGRTCFGYLWAEATAARHWHDADFVRAGSAVKQVLRKRYPTLSQTAVEAVVRAASYQWQ